MDITIQPRRLRGKITIIPSKSQAHRLLICAAFADRQTKLICPESNRDIEATADCLRALGANIARCDDGYIVTPVAAIPETAVLDCCESGSTLRFMLPIAGALGVDTTFLMEGRLPKRPLSPLWEEMERMGCSLSRPTESTIRCSGMLLPGAYSIDGGVSSQFITGLMYALTLMNGPSTLQITGKIESRPYIDMTVRALQSFGADTHRFGTRPLRSPGTVEVEGDWSNAAFFLAANAVGSELTILGLNENSPQGDKAVAAHLKAMENGIPAIDAADIPDLVPILSVAAACKHGAVFDHISRLRLKESDRVASVCAMLGALGGKTAADQDTLTVYPANFTGGTVDACGDHRIAMSAAIAATAARAPVTILGAECTAKSYPRFWAEYARLGGIYEQHIR